MSHHRHSTFFPARHALECDSISVQGWPQEERRGSEMNLHVSASSLFWIVVCFPAALLGCDAVRTTTQTLRVQIVEVSTGKPLTRAQISIKPELEITGDQNRDEARAANWKHLPRHDAHTNEEGIASIEIRITAHDWEKGDSPPSRRDVRGDRYATRIESGSRSENTVIDISEGETFVTESYQIEVLTLSRPMYID